MTSIDDQIRRMLSDEDRHVVEHLDDQAGLFEMLGMAFRGKQAWMTWYMWFMGFFAFLAGLFCLYRFFATDDLKMAMAWMLGINVCLSFIIVIKVIGWQQLQKLELMREIKRMELRHLLHRDDQDTATGSVG